MVTNTLEATKRKMRAAENAKTLKKAEQKRLAEFNDPENIARREWLKAAFKHDIDQITHFAVRMMAQQAAVHKENEELVVKLNRIYSIGFGLSEDSMAKPHEKYNIARMSLDLDPKDPVARAFISAMQTSRTLTAVENARKAHAPARVAKVFVQREWAMHRAAYDNNKSAFSRHYVKRVLNELDVNITEKQMREIWLKDTASGGKHASHSAAGRDERDGY